MVSLRRPCSRLSAVVSLVVGALVLVGGGVASAGTGERIERYDVDITVDDDGALLVRETIRYDFGGNQRHGIERFIPVRERADDTYDRIIPLDDLEVSAGEGTPDEWERTPEGSLERIRVGDPDRTVTGAHTYELSYRARGVLNGFDEHVELYWDAVGSEWSVPIDEAGVRVDTPAQPTRVACFMGPPGTTQPCPVQESDASGATFAADGLQPGDALTIVVALPVGAVPPPEPVLEERWTPASAFALTPATVGLSSVLLLAGVGGVGALLWRRGRDRRFAGSPVDVAFGSADGTEERVPLFERTETPVEFVPPDGIRPGQVGTLVDEVAHPLDVTATIIDFAVRGYLRIEEIEKDGWFSSPDWRLHRLRDGEGLLPYERTLFDGLFDGAHRDEVAVSELKNRFASRLAEVQSGLYDDVAERGWFHTRPDHERTRWLSIGIVVAVFGVILTVGAAALTSFGLVPIPVVLAGVLLAAFSRRLPHRTAKGHGVLRRVQGFERFILESEKERAQFAEREHLFSEYLPYAIVFGATERWAKAFAGLDGQLPQGGWYTGVDVFTYAHFTGAMHGFTVTTAGTLTSVPTPTGGAASGGSGFSGGFSGGGFGGGGGGSW